jgi:hypothetical protein
MARATAMIPDRHTWRAAQLMVKRYGEDAAVQAGLRIGELLAAGDVMGAAACRAMILAIGELQRAAPRT